MKPLATRLAPYELFFPAAALATLVAIVATRFALADRWTPPAGVAPLDWHAHEMLFGHFPAAFAGVMLTALPRWTKGPSMAPLLVAALASLFAAARLAWLLAPDAGLLWLSPLAVAAIAAYAGLRIVAADDRRDYGLVALLAVFAVADALFLSRALTGDTAPALRLGLAATALVATIMGGRIAPALTRHLAEKRGHPQAAPTPAPLEIAVFAATLPALAAWVVAPDATPTALLLGLAALLHAARLATWGGASTVDRPPFLALHLGYAFLPLGLAALALAAVTGDARLGDLGIHAFGTGTLGLMCAAIMTSVVRRYSGRALTVSRLADLLVAAIFAAALARLSSSLLGHPPGLVDTAVAAWIAGYGLLTAMVARDRRLPAEAFPAGGQIIDTEGRLVGPEGLEPPTKPL